MFFGDVAPNESERGPKAERFDDSQAYAACLTARSATNLPG